MQSIQEEPEDVGKALSDSIESVLEKCKVLQETAAGYSRRLKSEGDALGSKAISLEKEVKALLKKVVTAVKEDEISSDQADKMESDLIRARSMAYEGDIAALLPHKKNGFFLSQFLGDVNVRSVRRDVRLKVKQEYNAYRDRTAVVFLGAPLVMLIVLNVFSLKCLPSIVVHAYQAWLLLFYTSLAMRENILRVNGSDIRPWWIYHHYFAMLVALVSLTWGIDEPECDKKQEGIQLFLLWAILQGVAMLLQNRYQRRRLYTHIALGKAGPMDVVSGETAGMKGQLVLLYPLLFVLQAFQFYIGCRLIAARAYDVLHLQALICGLLLIIMAVGNFYNTMGTVITKLQIKASKKRKAKNLATQLNENANDALKVD